MNHISMIGHEVVGQVYKTFDKISGIPLGGGLVVTDLVSYDAAPLSLDPPDH